MVRALKRRIRAGDAAQRAMNCRNICIDYQAQSPSMSPSLYLAEGYDGPN